MGMKEKLTDMLHQENLVIDFHLSQVTIDPPMTVARIRADLIRELLRDMPESAGKLPHSPKTVQKWLVRILGHEGGYWDDPDGGPTKWGISQNSYPDLDIQSLSIEAAEKIYRRDYLNPLRADRFAPGLAFQLLDFAINSGHKAAIKTLQKALGLTQDGIIGSVTLSAIAEKSDCDMILRIIAARLKFMVSLKNWPANSRGWTDRMANNLLHAVEDID